MRGLLVWSIVMALGIFHTSDTSAARPAEMTVVAFGNSLTAGYGVQEQDSFPAQLQKMLHKAGYPAHVINAGYSGETSSRAVARLDRILSMRPDIVIVETGINDFLRNVPPETVKSNLQKIINTFREHGIRIILTGHTMEWFIYNGAEDFMKIYPELAEENGLILVPSFLDGVAGKPELNLADRVHPNGRGYRIITENIYPYVINVIDDLKKNDMEKP